MKRQEEVLPAAKLEQRRYNSIENGSRSGGLVKIITVLLNRKNTENLLKIKTFF
ncbi:MAG: hypothetical protein II089_01240 [Selenomonas sp.]|nr:hypothetical protein [Selenomonas sp.]